MCVNLKYLSREWCANIREDRQMSKINVEGGSDIIQSNEYAWEWFWMVFASPRIPLSQAKYLVSSLGSHEVKSFIPPSQGTQPNIQINCTAV